MQEAVAAIRLIWFDSLLSSEIYISFCTRHMVVALIETVASQHTYVRAFILRVWAELLEVWWDAAIILLALQYHPEQIPTLHDELLLLYIYFLLSLIMLLCPVWWVSSVLMYRRNSRRASSSHKLCQLLSGSNTIVLFSRRHLLVC